MADITLDIARPYLVIPKLVEQPTWGGSYIVENKGWAGRPGHDIKIGQSYELFSGSNLSLLSSSDDPAFIGEITDRDAVQIQTRPPKSITLDDLTAQDPSSVLGASERRGPRIELLIKFTQALGNSFQTHIKDGEKHDKWKPKPESWYYFEPGLLTYGIKDESLWEAYEQCVRDVHQEMADLSGQVTSGSISYEDATDKIKDLLQKYDPWQYVNTVAVKKDQVVDLSMGGVHHSWEEDSEQAPLGNVLLELQGEAMDDVSTFRSFDKGKMAADGTIRDVHLDTYFDVIDRDPETNDPESHIHDSQDNEVLSEDSNRRLERLMRSPHYDMDKLTLTGTGTVYKEEIDRYKHLFVKSGRIRVSAGGHDITVGTGHSCFIPASAQNYTVTNQDNESQILFSF